MAVAYATQITSSTHLFFPILASKSASSIAGMTAWLARLVDRTAGCRLALRNYADFPRLTTNQQRLLYTNVTTKHRLSTFGTYTHTKRKLFFKSLSSVQFSSLQFSSVQFSSVKAAKLHERRNWFNGEPTHLNFRRSGIPQSVNQCPGGGGGGVVGR